MVSGMPRCHGVSLLRSKGWGTLARIGDSAMSLPLVASSLVTTRTAGLYSKGSLRETGLDGTRHNPGAGGSQGENPELFWRARPESGKSLVGSQAPVSFSLFPSGRGPGRFLGIRPGTSALRGAGTELREIGMGGTRMVTDPLGRKARKKLEQVRESVWREGTSVSDAVRGEADGHLGEVEEGWGHPCFPPPAMWPRVCVPVRDEKARADAAEQAAGFAIPPTKDPWRDSIPLAKPIEITVTLN
eukprot:gene14498-biopygen10462